MISSGHSYIHHTLKGTKKKENGDDYLIIEKETYLLLAIFEGVGGAINSHKANLLAMTFIELHHDDFLAEEIRLDRLMYECNRYILDRNVPQSYTGYSIALIANDLLKTIYFSCMGSPRIYAMINRNIKDITKKAVTGAKDIIPGYLGVSTLTGDDFKQHQLKLATNTLLLCTNGFYSVLEKSPSQFCDILDKKNTKTIKDDLLAATWNKNIEDATYILVK
jgi:serine/threonine protein phosphatase PrpC